MHYKSDQTRGDVSGCASVAGGGDDRDRVSALLARHVRLPQLREPVLALRPDTDPRAARPPPHVESAQPDARVSLVLENWNNFIEN